LLIVKKQEKSRQGSCPAEIGKNGFAGCSALDFLTKNELKSSWRSLAGAQIKTFARGSEISDLWSTIVDCAALHGLIA